MTDREKDLIEAARQGEQLVCGELPIEELARTEDPRYVIRAELIRELLIGRHDDLDPRGIRVTRARISGQLDLDYVHATAPLRLSECVLDEPLRLNGAQLAELDLSGSQLVSLLADDLQLRGNLLLKGIQIPNGEVRLVGAHIAGCLELGGAQLRNESGPALDADSLRVDGYLLARDRFRATGSGDQGVVNLLGARVANNLELDGARLTNTSGPALQADNLRVDGNLYLDSGFHATGAGTLGAIRLLGANIGGQLSMRAAVMENPDGISVDLGDAAISQTVILPAAMICADGAKTANQCRQAGKHITLSDLSYRSIRDSTWQEWLHLIRFHTSEYRPSPYQQLAAVERAAGHHENAWRILIAQQQDLRVRGVIRGRMARFIHRAWGLVAGYGYRVWRTAVALLIALALAGGLGWGAGQWSTGNGHHAAERTVASGSPGKPCSPVEQVGLGIDRGLPLASTGIRTRCDLDTASTAGQVFTVAIWVLQVLVWALATLAIAGYTGLIRKPA